MIELLRNCSHGSQISTYLAYGGNGGKKSIIKAASTVAGMSGLKRELEGWRWYQSLRYPDRKDPLCRVIREKEGRYLKIEINFIEGTRAGFNFAVEKNSSILKRAIGHYCDIWPYNASGLSALHGDLSLDNIIYNTDGIHIVDWEHFSSGGVPWGFDAMYLLFESLYFGIARRKKYSSREINLIADCIVMLNSRVNLAGEFIERPLNSVRDIIVTFPEAWGDHFPNVSRKLPVTFFTQEQVNLIDLGVSSKVKRML